MNALTTRIAAIVIGALAIVGFAYSGTYDVGADVPHGGPIHWLLATTSHASVARRAQDVDVPNLENDDLVRAGANDFEGMCIGCHQAPGHPPTALARGLNPPAPDLAESVRFMTPAELFWVTKHGIRMTGMPAWGATHEDDELWSVVALMLALPTLDADAYHALLRSPGGVGHSTPGHHEPPSLDEPPVEAEEHDHASHSH